ncbi:MAG: hypothetical protein ACIAQF_00620 [Phycisphaerales bacterium JB065]
MIASSAVIASVRIAPTSGLAARQHHDALATTDLFNSLRSACEQWIARQGGTAVIEPSLPYGAIPVLNDQIKRADQLIEIQITAYDQDTRISLRRLNELDASEYHGLLSLALDDETDLPELEVKLVRESESLAVYPSRANTSAVLGLARSPGLKLSSQTSSVSLNPRTVPDELVRVIYGDSAEQVLEELNEWRSRTERIGSSSWADFATVESAAAGNVIWAPETQAWAFRIDLETEHRRLAFWAVYEVTTGTGWRLRTWHRIGDGSE